MVFGGAMDDYVRRLGIHGAAPIPCVAHSLTEAESRAVGRGHIGWAASVLAIFGIMFGIIALTAKPRPDQLAWLGGTYAAIVLIGALITWLKLRKRQGYRDPRLRVEIGPDEVAVIGPASRDARPYHALAITDLLSGSTKSGRYFIGIALDTRLGAIRLEDEWYREGKAAAGAILQRMDELGLPLHAG